MTETAPAAPAAAETVRCGHVTSTGPCHRPEGHPKTGHISKSALDAKRAKAAGNGKALTPEEMEAREAGRAAKAAERIEAARAAHEAKVARLREAAAALGFKVVPMTAKEKASAAKAEG